MNKEEIKRLAEKICDLTGYGQALHPNDIIPELEAAYGAGYEWGVISGMSMNETQKAAYLGAKQQEQASNRPQPL